MYKIKIYDLDEDSEFFSEMPYLPKIGDQIGSSINGDLTSKKVTRLAHGFTEKGVFMNTEICISDEE